tara:strand:+ start:765 stop:1562 length:798 start_codon:yes stop_codon:yes gene_type:complete
MTDFGRVPILNVDVEEKTDKEIFDKPEAKSGLKQTNVDDDKKIKLKEHLAKCRAKSAEVRKAKALEKKANKKPVGRPKRATENVVLTVEQSADHAPQAPAEEPAEEPAVAEDEIFNSKTKRLETIKESPPPTNNTSEAKSTNNMFDMDMMLNKIDERMNEKLKAHLQSQSSIPTTSEAKPQSNMGLDPNVYSFVSYMKDQEEKIRNEERTKYVNELEQKKNDLLVQNNRKYFKKLPQRQFHQPIQQQTPQENNMWDDLLNPKKRY